MQKIVFYLKPLASFWDLTADTLVALGDLIEEIKYFKDEFCIPSEFFEIPDDCGCDYSEYSNAAYSEKHDEVVFFNELISKNNRTDVSYHNIEQECCNKIVGTGYVRDKLYSDELINKLVVTPDSSLMRFYREMSLNFTDYHELYDWRARLYPSLLFTDDAFNGSPKIGSLKDNNKELTKCLVFLNDIGKECYKLYSEEEAMLKLQAMSHVKCTGKGAVEHSNYKKTVVAINQYGHNVYSGDITCNPHFKLESAHSDKRIYFCWGRDEIQDHAVIVVHIGEHWKQKINAQKSNIYLLE